VPRVTVTLEINVPIHVAWSRIIDFASYPRFMNNVESAEIRRADVSKVVTSWQARLKGSILRWTDESVLDRDRWRIEFNQLDGDLERFDGYWQLTTLGEHGTQVCLAIDFEVGIPQLRALLNPAAGAAIKENCESMLRDLEKSVAAGGRRAAAEGSGTSYER
jgi:ribosome-associated toxin RatA of RatAB toxin-antitoxin module